MAMINEFRRKHAAYKSKLKHFTAYNMDTVLLKDEPSKAQLIEQY